MRIKMKWVALFLVIVMQMATVPQNISASSTATLIFDMNLDGVEAEAETGYVTTGVTNSVTDTTTAIVGKSRVADNAERPKLGEDAELGFKFLEFSKPLENAVRENNQAGLEVTFNDEAYFNSDEFTFETWAYGTNLEDGDGDAKGNYFAYLGLFTLGTKPTADETAFSTSTAYFGTFFGTGSAHNLFNLDSHATSVNSCVRIVRGDTSDTPSAQHTFGGADARLSAYEDEWKHYAVTMKWELDETTDSTTDGTWTSELYVDGVLQDTLTRKEALRHTFTEDEIPTLLIGASPHSAATFCGEIADFKMYTGVRTEEEIFATYKAERGNYFVMADVESHTLNEVTRDNREFSITFDQPVDPETVNAANISIEKADGTKLGLSESTPYDEDTRTVSFKLLDYFRYNTKYYLCLSGVKAVDGMDVKREKIEFTSGGKEGISISEPIITDKDNNPIDEIGENTSAKISVTVTGATENIISFAMIIYKDNRIVTMVKAEEAIGDAGSKTYTVSTEDEEITLEPGYKIKAFICSMEGEKGAVAFFDPIEIH